MTGVMRVAFGAGTRVGVSSIHTTGKAGPQRRR